VAVDNVRSTGTFAQPVTVCVPYPDADNDGVVDNTRVPASTLQVHVLDETTALWTAMNALHGRLGEPRRLRPAPHLSIFTALGTSAAGIAADLSGVRVYPIPYRPNGGDPNRGHLYSAGDPQSGIIFDNLPSTVDIEIYTIAGRRVARLSTAASSGMLQWDVRNESGQDVASGGYVAVLRSPGCGQITKQLIIVR